MKHNARRVVTTGAVLSALVALGAGAADASGGVDRWGSVPAITKGTGVTAPNALSPGLAERAVAQGSNRLENPAGDAAYYGYHADGPLLPQPGATQSSGHNVEATKSEPDKNTYLRLRGLHGADPKYDYGTHFLFQGHEHGPGYITRINLDADAAHRVTLLATKTTDGAELPAFDGSTWNPFAKKLLLTAEDSANGGVWQSDPDVGAKVQDISNVLGRGAYEGIQADSAGNLWIVEDAGGAVPSGTSARLPNSFVYRFVPKDKGDLTKGGTLQALQVISRRTGQPIGFTPMDATHPTGAVFSDDTKDLHTYGTVFETRWVTLHQGDASSTPFDANALAKAAKATPFKRPENGVFRPGADFREFFFTETGDTNATSKANGAYGGWGEIYRLTQTDPAADQGKLTIFYNGDQEHTGLDNIAFVDRDHVAAVEDAGDTLHSQRGAFDSAYLFDLNADYAKGRQPVRFLAEGRDPSATIDSAWSALGNGFQNDGDNEITGIHVSDGDPTVAGLLGEKRPRPFHGDWRIFWTQQHGDNTTWEITQD
ncbi:alkaline phosphatase PhoX [Actinoallomurus soli]|uniref:alkaline phosphatase PhoX n=1 Tax=Actinoallomurus soli TaxID=2952535 RepID=UPI0020935E69|nr:alkaline phosphatase PhoX [Actinoallomurus soli]MCO5971992.1 PhoX family protein [Actinoallomurus soli]